MTWITFRFGATSSIIQMFGFLRCPIIGTPVLRGPRPIRTLWWNWTAALKLALVHLGLAKDYSGDFDRHPNLARGIAGLLFL